VFQAKKLALSFLWHTWGFFLCADRTLRRYDGGQLRHSAAITWTTSVAKVGDAGFTVSFLQPKLRYHIRAASSAERDTWVHALVDASIADGPVISFADLYLGSRIDVPAKQLGQVLLPCYLVCSALCVRVQHLCQPPLPFPPCAQLQFLPLQLQRFLRSCVLATAHALVTPHASVFRLVHARTKIRWIERIFVRVMSSFVARSEVRRQRARCACAPAITICKRLHGLSVDELTHCTANSHPGTMTSSL
jgi:hypothetical protein